MSVQALNKIIPISSAGDVFALGQEADWADMSLTDVSAPKIIDLIDSKKVTGGDYLPAGILVTESSIVRAKEVIELMYKTGNAAKTSVIPGPETSGGNIMALFTADDNVAVFQAMAHDKSPKFTLLGDVGSKTIQLDVVPSSQSISSDGNFEPVNDGITTDLSGVPTALAVTVQLTSATLASNSTPGTVDIVGIGTDGTSTTEQLSFASAVLGDPQTTTATFKQITDVRWAEFSAGTISVKSAAMALPGMLPDKIAIATGVSVVGTGAITIDNNLSSITNPVQITVTPKTGSALVTGKTFATVRIVGIDQYDNPMDKVLTFTPSGTTFTALKTVAFFKQITNVYGDANWAAGSTVDISALDTACEVEIHPQDSEDVVYFTVAGNKGGIPDRHISQLMTTLTIGNARNEALLFQLESMGYRALLRTDMAGVKGVNAEEIDFSDLTPALPNVYPGWACYIMVAGERQPYNASSISIAQGYTYFGAQSGTPYEEVRPYRNDRRVVMIDGTVARTKANDLVGKYAANVIYEDVRYVYEMTHAETFNWKTEIILRESQLAAETDVASPTGIDRYLQQQNLQAFSNSFGNPKDWYAKIRLSNYNRVRDYAEAA